jgi:hypothetical protein
VNRQRILTRQGTERKSKQPLPVKVNRDIPAAALQPFTDYFQGFEKVEAVRKVFGDDTGEVLSRLKIGFISNRRMYMGIRDHDGNIAVGTYHLRHSPNLVLYLDIVHELFHIKQWMNDKEWFTREHEKFMGDFRLYYSSPIEVPAYKHTVREAERLGMTPTEIVEYLEMMPVTPKIWNKFLKAMEMREGAVTAGAPQRVAKEEKKEKELPVKIHRQPKLILLPFTDYFQGFEEAPPIKALFGDGASSALKGIKIEFLESPFGSIFPSDDEDGHLVVNSSFIRDADLESIYLDVVLCLNILKRATDKANPVAVTEVEFAESPLVLESYRAMVDEARRIGTPDSKIIERMQLPRFMMTEASFRKLLRALGLKPPAAAAAGAAAVRRRRAR